MLSTTDFATRFSTTRRSSPFFTPFSFRKATPNNPFLREMLVPFGASGYVALYEIDDEETVTILALRHQREDDYR